MRAALLLLLLSACGGEAIDQTSSDDSQNSAADTIGHASEGDSCDEAWQCRADEVLTCVFDFWGRGTCQPPPCASNADCAAYPDTWCAQRGDHAGSHCFIHRPDPPPAPEPVPPHNPGQLCFTPWWYCWLPRPVFQGQVCTCETPSGPVRGIGG